MKALMLTLTTALVLIASQAGAVLLTFEDVPPNYGPLGLYYQQTYSIVFGGTFTVADHSASTWGPPRSGGNVLLIPHAELPYATFGFKWDYWQHPVPYPPYASSVSGYFSTEPGVVLQMIAYYAAPGVEKMAVGQARIGGEDAVSWSNTYVEIVGSPRPISWLDITPVTPNALEHFCVDDLTIEFVPEPSSLASLSLALLAAGAGVRWRRRG